MDEALITTKNCADKLFQDYMCYFLPNFQVQKGLISWEGKKRNRIFGMTMSTMCAHLYTTIKFTALYERFRGVALTTVTAVCNKPGKRRLNQNLLQKCAFS